MQNAKLRNLKKIKILIEVSARHVHLSQKDLEILFGKGKKLTKLKNLSQPGQFAAKETVDLIGSKGMIKNVRIIGPCRHESQVEVSKTDGYKLGDIPPIRVSGDIIGTPGILLRGPKGEKKLERGLICAMRHIHMSPQEAASLGISDKQMVSVEIFGKRALVYKNVIVRVDPNFRLAFQIDTDEANAGDVETGDIGELKI
jgi:propanediol utilization protein